MLIVSVRLTNSRKYHLFSDSPLPCNEEAKFSDSPREERKEDSKSICLPSKMFDSVLQRVFSDIDSCGYMDLNS